MKFTSILLTFLSATVVTAYEHNAKSMLRGVDTKVRVSGAPTICRKNNDCDGSDTCDLTDTVLSFCSHYTTNAKPHCCVSPDEEDTLSKKAEAMEKVAKVLPLLKDAAKVKSDAMVKEDDNSTPICGCDDPYACPAGSTCEDWGDCSFGCMKCDGVDPCDSKNCPNSKPICTTNWDACRGTCSATSLKLKDAAKVKSDAMVKEDDNSLPPCECPSNHCKDGYDCVLDAYCTASCIATQPAPVDPVPEPATTTVATSAAACGGENPCDSKNCPNSKPICTPNYEICRGTCSAN